MINSADNTIQGLDDDRNIINGTINFNDTSKKPRFRNRFRLPEDNFDKIILILVLIIVIIVLCCVTTFLYCVCWPLLTARRLMDPILNVTGAAADTVAIVATTTLKTTGSVVNATGNLVTRSIDAAGNIGAKTTDPPVVH